MNALPEVEVQCVDVDSDKADGDENKGSQPASPTVSALSNQPLDD